MDDDATDVLRGFFFHSRYITRRAFRMYGLDTTVYEVPPTPKMIHSLRSRLKELLVDWGSPQQARARRTPACSRSLVAGFPPVRRVYGPNYQARIRASQV